MDEVEESPASRQNSGGISVFGCWTPRRRGDGHRHEPRRGRGRRRRGRGRGGKRSETVRLAPFPLCLSVSLSLSLSLSLCLSLSLFSLSLSLSLFPPCFRSQASLIERERRWFYIQNFLLIIQCQRNENVATPLLPALFPNPLFGSLLAPRGFRSERSPPPLLLARVGRAEKKHAHASCDRRDGACSY